MMTAGKAALPRLCRLHLYKDKDKEEGAGVIGCTWCRCRSGLQ